MIDETPVKRIVNISIAPLYLLLKLCFYCLYYSRQMPVIARCKFKKFKIQVCAEGGSTAEAFGFGSATASLKIAQGDLWSRRQPLSQNLQKTSKKLLTNRGLYGNISAQQSRAAMRSHLTDKVPVRSID